MAKRTSKNSPVAESTENKVEEVGNETTTETSETTETETKTEEVESEAPKVEEKPAKEKKPKAEKKPKLEKPAPGPDEKEVLKTSEQWLEESPYRIMTHDGWNRKNESTFKFSFYEEKISKKEFDKRLLKSAVKPK